jgi:hypothetical protein
MYYITLDLTNMNAVADERLAKNMTLKIAKDTGDTAYMLRLCGTAEQTATCTWKQEELPLISAKDPITGVPEGWTKEMPKEWTAVER